MHAGIVLFLVVVVVVVVVVVDDDVLLGIIVVCEIVVRVSFVVADVGGFDLNFDGLTVKCLNLIFVSVGVAAAVVVVVVVVVVRFAFASNVGMNPGNYNVKSLVETDIVVGVRVVIEVSSLGLKYGLWIVILAVILAGCREWVEEVY